MRIKGLLTLFLVILALIPITYSDTGLGGVVSWVIDVDESGYSRVDIEIRGRVGETYWIVLPSQRVPEMTPKQSPSTYTYSSEPVGYFYDNYSFTFLGVDSVRISYEFEMAVLFEKDRGMLISPLIEFDPRLAGEITVRIENALNIIDYSPMPNTYDRVGNTYILNYTFPANLLPRSRRISVLYQLAQPLDEVSMRIGEFVSVVPSPHAESVKTLMTELKDMNEDVSRFFGFKVEGIELIFYIPESINSAGGFVPVEGGEVPDEIHINLLMFRYLPGYLELVALHELIHHYVARLGVSPDLRWFHEGAATFFSIQFLLGKGFEAVEEQYREAEALSFQMPDVSFILDWTGGYGPPSYYMASYKVFRELNSTLGLSFFEKLFRAMKGGEYDVSGDIFSVMSDVSGGRSDEVLARLNLLEDSGTRYVEAGEYYLRDILRLTAIILALAVAALMAINLKLSRRKGSRGLDSWENVPHIEIYSPPPSMRRDEEQV